MYLHWATTARDQCCSWKTWSFFICALNSGIKVSEVRAGLVFNGIFDALSELFRIKYHKYRNQQHSYWCTQMSKEYIGCRAWTTAKITAVLGGSKFILGFGHRQRRLKVRGGIFTTCRCALCPCVSKNPITLPNFCRGWLQTRIACWRT